ncbi:MAG TPA: NADH-quinone oxidoreductase subunit C [Dehalococcoidia bacterium]|nr:NADH-quinone oxidoreductase subunit C [Dehalococcoidia bacterium]
MTVALSGKDIAARVEEKLPGSLEDSGDDYLLVKADSLVAVAEFLKNTESLNFDYFNFVTAVDYYSYFEVVYRLESVEHNHSIVIKTRCYDRDNPAVPSLAGLWQGANFQEREVYDLMGIKFEGHPNLKRMFLWDGFEGHPLRKDWNK